MVSFFVYDLVFLVAFGLFATLYFYNHRENLKRQGWMFLYHSKVGIRFIDWTAKKFEKVLRPLSYFVIGLGYFLMGAIVWMIGKTAWLYVTSPIPKELQNLPPIAPLIPYFPKIFGLESIFPPLYFTYFIIAIAIVAISHEFSHGIFARLWGIEVKTTGLAFFGPFFGAFVEPDEKKMNKAPKFQQLSILAAGVFANIMMFVVFALILWGFFAVSFNPGGVIFNTYGQKVVNVSDISYVEGVSINNYLELEAFSIDGLNHLTLKDGEKVLAPKDSLTAEILSKEQIVVFDDAPAITLGIQGAITNIGDYKIDNYDKLTEALKSYNPGDNIEVKTILDGEVNVYNVTLDDHEGKAYLGIGFYDVSRVGSSGKFLSFVSNIKDPRVYYEPSWDGDFVKFIYDLLWWIVVINVLVALVNMLPLSILDGGRFFYLTIWGISKSEKVGRKTYKIVTLIIFAMLILMTLKWLFGYF